MIRRVTPDSRTDKTVVFSMLENKKWIVLNFQTLEAERATTLDNSESPRIKKIWMTNRGVKGKYSSFPEQFSDDL